MRERAAPEGSQTKREDKEGRGCGCELACVISVEGHSLWKRSSDKKKKTPLWWEDPWILAAIFAASYMGFEKPVFKIQGLYIIKVSPFHSQKSITMYGLE